ncbi:MAG: hypothetical protein K0V04_10005, partial [Deltaproteobacteria bacterium]|nr:hypothetical protein [Deltaproteobacteria bacterium]
MTCEPSGVVQRGETIWAANDKPLPGASSMMQLALDGEGLHRVGYAPAPALDAFRKLEDLSAVPGTAGLLATTGFDRFDADSAERDRYNGLLAWTPGHDPVVVVPTTR